ncbi:MAG: transposase [Rhizobiales bacterium]|nr:transposase [Hyphomicrobiales bacterium]
MADSQEAEATQITAEAPAKPASAEPKKRVPRATKTKAAKPSGKAEAKPSRRNGAKAAEAPAPTVRAGRRTYSDKERAQKLSQIEKSIAGGAGIRSAVGQVGISEQTYYQWKRNAASASGGGELKDLLGLEEENKRLKKMLAERLREENAQLKKRLGIK